MAEQKEAEKKEKTQEQKDPLQALSNLISNAVEKTQESTYSYFRKHKAELLAEEKKKEISMPKLHGYNTGYIDQLFLVLCPALEELEIVDLRPAEGPGKKGEYAGSEDFKNNPGYIPGNPNFKQIKSYVGDLARILRTDPTFKRDKTEVVCDLLNQYIADLKQTMTYDFYLDMAKCEQTIKKLQIWMQRSKPGV